MVLQKRPTRVAWRNVFPECLKEMFERVSHRNVFGSDNSFLNVLCFCAFGFVGSIADSWLDPKLFLVKFPIVLLKSPFLMVERTSIFDG